eukprot:171034_1
MLSFLKLYSFSQDTKQVEHRICKKKSPNLKKMNSLKAFILFWLCLAVTVSSKKRRTHKTGRKDKASDSCMQVEQELSLLRDHYCEYRFCAGAYYLKEDDAGSLQCSSYIDEVDGVCCCDYCPGCFDP